MFGEANSQCRRCNGRQQIFIALMSIVRKLRCPYSRQRRRITLPTENHSLKDTNSWTIKPANFNVYTHRLVSWCKAGCDW